MIEKFPRFMYNLHKGIILDNGRELMPHEAMKLLNSFNDENERLKKENQELRKYLSWQDMELEEMEDLND